MSALQALPLDPSQIHDPYSLTAFALLIAAWLFSRWRK